MTTSIYRTLAEGKPLNAEQERRLSEGHRRMTAVMTDWRTGKIKPDERDEQCDEIMRWIDPALFDAWRSNRVAVRPLIEDWLTRSLR